MATGRTAGIVVGALAVMLLLLVSGCSSSDDDERPSRQLAQQLVDADAGRRGRSQAHRRRGRVAVRHRRTGRLRRVRRTACPPRSRTCSSATRPTGRRKTITDDAVTYGRLVVETYCPDSLDEYDDVVDDLDPFETSDSMSTTDGAAPVTGEPTAKAAIRAIATMAWPALGMLMVASVGSIAQLSDSASFGLGAVTVYLLPALLFLLPVGLVSAELATSNRGGIFVWVKDAFGDRTGFQATWFVFMNSVTLYPSLLSFGAAALATAFGRPDLASNGAYMGTVVLVVFWLATWIVSRGMKSSTGISNIGLALGTITPALFLIVFMFAWLIDAKPSQIHFAVCRHGPAGHRPVEHRAGGRHVRRLRRPRGQRRAHRPPEGPAEELPEVGAAGRASPCSSCTCSARWPSRSSCPTPRSS